MKLATVGYEKETQAVVIGKLKDAGVELVIDVLGLLNSGVFVMLNASPRISTFRRSRNRMFLNSDALSTNNPGPLKGLRPVLPNVTPVGWAKLAWLNHGLPTLMPFGKVRGAT